MRNESGHHIIEANRYKQSAEERMERLNYLFQQQEANESLIKRTKELEKQLKLEREDIKKQRLEMAGKLAEIKKKGEAYEEQKSTLNYINRVDCPPPSPIDNF